MSAEPRLIASVPIQRRVRIPKVAAVELAARYRARAEVERRLVDYLLGIVLAKGLRIEDVEGFDDATGELLLAVERDHPLGSSSPVAVSDEGG